MAAGLAGSPSGTTFTESYVRALGRLAFLWGWPLVNIHNRQTLMSQLPEPGLLAGIVPGAPPGSLSMLHDYIRPEERVVACPNQDVVYGFGILDSEAGPSVVQVPEFGDRFWVYQVVDQRTDSFVQLGAMYGTKPGFYLLADTSWDGEVPEGIEGVFRRDTRLGVVIPRCFMDDTPEDRQAILPLVQQIAMYPLSEYTGELRRYDWTDVPSFGGGDSVGGGEETQWVDPTSFFATLPEVLDEVPPRPGEEALYTWISSLLEAADDNKDLGQLLVDTAVEANRELVTELFQFRNVGIPVADHWTTQRNGAMFGADYLTRAAVGKSNIFVNVPSETTYFYQDLDSDGERLSGAHTYEVRFAELPPVRGFWSLTVYNEHHFFHPNELNRYSLGTKNKNLVYGDDGSLTLYVSEQPPGDEAKFHNWLPTPTGEFSVYLRAYWPEESITEGTWTPPAVNRKG